jgi:xanthine dehydrogenase accessory factor
MNTDVYQKASELVLHKARFAVATVVRIEGSSSAKPGSKAIIDERGNLIKGWVGGGCAESAVRTEARNCIAEDRTAVIMLDMTDEVFGVGMPCGGKMEVYIEPVLPKPVLLVIGRGRIAEVLCTLGNLMEFSVNIIDFTGQTKAYPAAERVSNDIDLRETKLDSNTYVVIATQHKNDHLYIEKALAGEAAYIGLIASQKRSKLVMEYAIEVGVPASKLDRVRAPAGFDLGARLPEEIALSIMSEIVSTRRGATGRQLAKDASTLMKLAPSESQKVITKCDV